ncbi:uncharacterized protein HD556DRAFT_740360 [Suillus plorans]|uniref:Uncharacterized protein n=1 Tax=Suillus plorans TaxID=116603 RepID=A0A9P7AID0_9AGAM|nr:uncharacterized protein HD556DRAFT_740360 [Suillus plorans]KAG1790193.1 hypothetical protein HD556DRAFT_740360 [Suillus plorans]
MKCFRNLPPFWYSRLLFSVQLVFSRYFLIHLDSSVVYFLVFLDIFTLSTLESDARFSSRSWYICLCLLSLQCLVTVSHACRDGCSP